MINENNQNDSIIFIISLFNLFHIRIALFFFNNIKPAIAIINTSARILFTPSSLIHFANYKHFVFLSLKVQLFFLNSVQQSSLLKMQNTKHQHKFTSIEKVTIINETIKAFLQFIYLKINSKTVDYPCCCLLYYFGASSFPYFLIFFLMFIVSS